MRALFVTNQRKTEFYSPVARRMAEVGVEIYWISTGGRWTRYLLAQGWPRARILTLHDFGPEWSGDFKPTPEDWRRAARIEAAFDVSLKNTLIMDRELNKQPGLSSEAYVHVITREIERFVRENDIAVAFGEGTWAQEILTCAVMKSLGRRYCWPDTIRNPSHRFGFFQGMFQDSLEVVGEATAEHRNQAIQAIERLRDRGEKPFYFERLRNPQRFRPHWIEEARLAIMRRREGRYEYSVPKLRTRIARRLAARANVAHIRRTGILEGPPPAGERPYLLVLLQRQPESSIDVFGRMVGDQLEAIRALVRTMPFDWEVWIKEHPHGVGDRSIGYFRQLLSLPGVRLIHPDADTIALMRGAGLVATMSGSSCMEAGILGLPAVTIGPMYFGDLLLVNGLNPFAMTHHDMARLLERAAAMRADPHRDKAIEDAMTELVSRSFEGLISDPISTPECVHPENIRKVADGTAAFLRHLEQSLATDGVGPQPRPAPRPELIPSA